jgi:two-component response regulator ARR-B family
MSNDGPTYKMYVLMERTFCSVLSVNGETKSVMKGITHGACDYLLKPVRIEELRNIWQHVVRRKFSNRERNNLDVYKEPPTTDSCHGHSQIVSRASDQSGRLSKKRKELHSEEEDDGDENDFQEGDEPSAAKKPRVVWSVELHQKFVAAVNQLGIDSNDSRPFLLLYVNFSVHVPATHL